MARPFTCGGANYVGVRDLASSVAWYVEKLGLREIEVEMDEAKDASRSASQMMNTLLHWVRRAS